MLNINTITFLVLCLFLAHNAECQNEIRINDVYYERMFKRVVINSAQTLKTTTDTAKKYGQRTKYGVEGTFLDGKYPAFGAISEQPFGKSKLSWNFGYMLYKMAPIDSFPGSEKIGQLASMGLSLYTKYVKVYSGAVLRAGNNPQLGILNDTTYYIDNSEIGLAPFLYIDYPGKRVCLNGSITPTPNMKSIGQAGLMLGFRFFNKKIKNENYTDVMKTPNGYDYDSGMELKYIFDSPLDGDNDKFYARTRVGKAFSLNSAKKESAIDGFKNKDNGYVLAENGIFLCCRNKLS